MGALTLAGGHVEAERQLATDRRPGGVGGIGLGERAEAARRMVVEPPNARIAPEVVVERPVLLHQEHHVLDGPQIRSGRDGRRSLGHRGGRSACRQQGTGARSQRPSQEESPIERRTGSPRRTAFQPWSQRSPSSTRNNAPNVPRGEALPEGERYANSRACLLSTSD